MSTTIESLELQINSNAQSAIGGIEALASSLSKLKTATSGGLGLNTIAKNLASLKTSLSGMSSISGQITGLQSAIQTLNQLGGVKISSSLANQITNLGTAINGLSTSGFAPKIQELTTALQPLMTLGKSNLSSVLTPLRKLPETMQGLNSVDMGAFASKIRELTNALRPLATEMQKITAGFSSFPGKANQVATASQRISTTANAASMSYINMWAKFRMAYMYIRIIAQAIGACIGKINDYVENINLFNVAMGDFAKEAGEYAEQVGEVMGIDPGEWMRNQGVFMTLATGFGVASDRAYTMSKNLTQLGYDLSSFFNIGYDEAMTKLQSGLAGELKPLRRIGYDLSQTRLQQEAYTLGIKKKVSAMTQAEKAELRYYAIMTQVTTAHGDMARTLHAPANQVRVFKAQLEMAGRAIGSIFIPMLNKILPVATAVVKVIRLLAETIANLLGFELPEVDYSGVNGMASGAEDAADALGEAADQAKKVQKYTMGFDELNVIDPDKGKSGSDAGAGTGTGFGFELPEYDFMSGAVQMQLTGIVDKMKEWLGLTEPINSWSEFFDTRLGRILRTVGLIGAGMLLWKISKSTIAAIATLKTLLASPTYTIVIGAILTIIGVSMAFGAMKEAIQNGLDKYNFGEIIGGALLTGAGAAALGSAIVVWIGKVCSTKMAFALAEMGRNIGVATTGALGAAIGAAVAGIVVGIPAFFVGIYDACKNGLNWLNGLLVPLGATMAGAGIGAIIGMLGGPIGAGIGALIGLAVGALTDLGILVYQKWDEIKAFFAPVAEWFDATFGAPIRFLIEWWTTLYTHAKDIITGIGTAFMSMMKKNIEIAKKIGEIFAALGKAFVDYVVEPIKKKLSPAATWVKDKMITPVWEKVLWLKTKVVEVFKTIAIGIVDFIAGAIKSVINGLINLIETRINGFILLLNGAVDIINKIPGVNITHVELLSIPRLAEGGMPATGQMFIAREAGPEMVGSIGRRTAVANNDQIVAGIASGVASANSESNALLREQNSLLRAMLEKETGVYLDGKAITKSVEKHQRERGRVLVTGGAY